MNPNTCDVCGNTSSNSQNYFSKLIKPFKLLSDFDFDSLNSLKGTTQIQEN